MDNNIIKKENKTIELTAENIGKELQRTDITHEQKTAIVSAWLFQEGKEQMSFITDLVSHQGRNTAENRVFKGTMREDFESLAGMFTRILDGLAYRLDKDLEKGESQKTIIKNVIMHLKKGSIDISDNVRGKIQERMKNMGYGIYLDRKGTPYYLDENENALKEKVEEDIQEMYKENKDKNGGN